MPLHGKIVVVKRSGGDGTEFPLTAACLFGRKPTCDIRIQLPQVSKEHCRIDFNENKEVVLTNLSSVNPTRVNGEALQQSERLKHGDVITIIDRSFRFEYPPAPTPKKRRSSIGDKAETVKVLQGDTVATGTGEKRISEVCTDPHLKDGTNHDNIQRAMEKTVVEESKGDDSLLQSKPTSPFNDLYQMIKKSLDVKTPRKSSGSKFQTPSSKFCTPKRGAVSEYDGKPAISTEGPSMKDDATNGEAQNVSNGTPKSVKKQVPATEMDRPVVEAEHAKSEAITPQKRHRATPQRSTISEVIEQGSAQTPKSPMRRRSKEVTPAKEQEQAMPVHKTPPRRSSPRNSEKAEKVKELSTKRKSGELSTDLPKSQMKKKRVSFGGHLSPELFDKKLPPDSPLRKGAAPRRSLCVPKTKQSLLRRASVIGLLKEQSPSPKKSTSVKNASPKTPTPGKKSPKSNTSSPKAQSPGKKSPKPRTPSPKAPSPGKKSPKSNTSSPKAQSPGKKSPATPRRSSTPAQVVDTPTVQGRFSVSRISTPSPVAEDAVMNQVPSVTVTPKIHLRRKSMKSASRKTPSMAKSAVKVIARRSGISRASMKASNSWADIVKFGQTKVQMAAPAKQTVNKITKKKTVCKPQTPARKLIGHVSTGHADSPVTILVGRAHKQKVVQPTGAAPRVVTNIALSKKNMKMDEDLTGITEMFKTPANERKRRSVISENSAIKTPMGGLSTSVVEPSVLKTPEESGEMIVSPLTVASTVKGRKYNSEAVQRLLNGDQESSFVSDTSALEIHTDDSGEQQFTDVTTTSVKTPKQKPELPECLTGVKRIMKTPRQKAEPVEDIRGKLLKTPKQKPEQQECLTGVKRIMKTPRLKSAPVEDIRGKLLKTPKQKPEQQECLTGVKRIMQTPEKEAEPLEDVQVELLKTPKAAEDADVTSEVVKELETPAHMEESEKPEQQECVTGVKTPQQDAEPLEDIQGELVKTPKQKPEQQECLTGVKRIMQTPEKEAEPLEDVQVELLKTPKAAEDADVTFEVVKELETSANMEESETLPEMKYMEEPVEKDFGIITPMKSSSLKGDAPVEEIEEPQELMEESLTNLTEPMETIKVEDQTPLDCGLDIAKESDTTCEDQQDSVPCTQIEDGPSDGILDVPQVNMEKGDADEVVSAQLEVPSAHDVNESSDTKETISQAAVEENLPEEQLKAETAPSEVVEVDTTASDPDDGKKPTGGKMATTVDSKAAKDNEEATEQSEDSIVRAPVRGRRGKKTEATAPPAVKQTTRSRNAKSSESKDAELTQGESAPLPSKIALKPKRGRNAKKASDDQAEVVQEVTTETEMVQEPESEQSPPVDDNHTADDGAAPLGKAVVKPRRGRKNKQESVPEQQDVPSTHTEDVLQADMAKEADAKEVSSSQLEVVIESDENKSSDAMETVTQAPAAETLPAVETATCKVTEIVQKKAARGRKAKLVESKSAEDNQEPAEHCEDAVDPAPVRGRRGKRTAAIAPPAVRQTTRGRNAKSQESDDQPEAVEMKPVTEISPEATPDQTPINASQEENESPPPEKESVLKPSRGRKTKQTPVEPPQSEPEKSEIVSDQFTVDQPQQPTPTVGKQRRGRKTNPDTLEQNEVAKDTVITVETKQPSQPPVRAKRGRNAKHEEEKVEKDGKTPSIETTQSQEPVKKTRRTRKAEQDQVESQEEVQTVETLVPQEAEAPLAAEPVKMNEQATVAAKPRRGRKANQDTESVTPVESTETQEVPLVSTTDKPKRGRRVKQVAEEVDISAEVPEEKPDHELETEKQQDVEPNATVIKTSRARGAKTSVKNEISQAIPAKRARRGTAPSHEETKTEAAVLASEIAPASVEPAKRGRRAAAKPTAEDATESSDQAKLPEDSSNALVEDTKTSKKYVQWKADVKVHDITPAKAVRGRKKKLSGQDDTESNNANKTEEKDLSVKAVESQPAKRARRGAKVADVTTDESTSKVNPKKGNTVQAVEVETQPKTRRGRSAKK